MTPGGGLVSCAALSDWRVGDKLVHPFDPDLGVGEVRAVEGRFLDVFFPDAERELRLTSEARLARPGTAPPSPLERLATGDVDPVEAFRNRVDGLRVAELREAGGLGSFLGGRIELFPHQLHTALQAVRSDPVRWLLADEVGLGKTVEACLILSALVRTGRSERAIVVAPDTLTVQWLGELYRKFHQVFTLLDRERLAYTAREFGDGFNPFVAHRHAVVSFERLAADPSLLEHALACEPDLVVFDEAHRLCAPELGGRIGPLVRSTRHALLLTATPLVAELRGFHALVDLLRPGAFGSYARFERALESGEAALPCTSLVRRRDLGGFPPRRPLGIDLPAATGRPATDPRARWIAARVPEWRARGEKALVFVGSLDELEPLHAHLERASGVPAAVFHEKLDLEQRDIRLARFREGDAPLLLCSEAGGEGRNFQFCERMVHYDLPSDPVRLEQRIGRLDRIGRDRPVEIVYFRCAGARPDLAGRYERLDLFATPPESGDAPRVLCPDAYDPSMADAVLARVPPDLDRMTEQYCVEAARQLGLKVVSKPGAARYYIELTGAPGGADAGRDRAAELATADWEGMLTRVDSLPGVSIHALPGHGNDVRFLGTFDRAEAIQHQSLAFFASGQMLVEGLMLELEDGPRGRATRFGVEGTGHRGAGLLCLYKDAARWTPVAVDAGGAPRPEWIEPLLRALPGAAPLRGHEASPEAIRALGDAAAAHASGAKLVAAAFFAMR